jgi:hypothetical protein
MLTRKQLTLVAVATEGNSANFLEDGLAIYYLEILESNHSNFLVAVESTALAHIGL